MAIFIEDVLDLHVVDAILDALSAEAVFVDGKKTAGRTAKKVKHNVQAQASSVEGIRKMVEKHLLANRAFSRAAIPLKFAKVMFSKYEVGMNYGEHVDDAFIAKTRTDLSFTLFLSDPDSYEGGELVIKRHDGDEKVKLPKGSLYLYPSSALHYVAPVTSGVRIAAVGWVQSRVRLQDHREILFDVATALSSLKETQENAPTRLQLLKVQQNLMRLWAD
jgi:PKHD-type hydroxylase